MPEIQLVPEMDRAIKKILRDSEKPYCLYAAARIEALESLVFLHEANSGEPGRNVCLRESAGIPESEPMLEGHSPGNGGPNPGAQAP